MRGDSQPWGQGVLVSTIQGTPGSECILSRTSPVEGLVLTPFPFKCLGLDPISAEQVAAAGADCRAERRQAKEHRPVYGEGWYH